MIERTRANMDLSRSTIDASKPSSTVYSRASATGFAALFADLREGFHMHGVWLAFSADQIRRRYRRSALGLAWMAISFLVFVAAISFFFASFSTLGIKGFVAYVASGLVAFNFLISNINDGCHVFRASSGWIKSASLPYSVYVYQGVARALFPSALHMSLLVVILVTMGWQFEIRALLIIPAIVIFAINAVWIQYFLGLVAARWRDIAHAVQTFSRLLFFASPILWVYAEQSGPRKDVAQINPLTHFIEIFRAPILGDPYMPQSWYVVLGCTAAGWILTIFAASRMRFRLPFWL